jgi:glycosyltransferase involved in cell wall biosynthesis
MRPVRVLRIIARLNVGGPAQHVVWLSAGLAKEGFETLLVTGTVPAGEEDMSAFAAAHGVTPLVLPSMSRELSWRDLTTIFQLRRVMQRFKPDIVHTHTAKAGAVGRVAGMLYRGKCKYVHTFHGHIFHGYYSRLKTMMFLAIERFLAKRTDRIIVLSEQQRDEIYGKFKVGKRDQFAIVPLGIDLTTVNGQRPTANETVGIVGRLTAIKNHDLFLRAAERMRGEARFVVIGDGAERERLERAAGDNVEFLGTLPVEQIYGRLGIVALTSRNEGTPLALIEAMAAGRAVISTAVGGVVDLLGAVVESRGGYDVRERGVTVASGDPDGLVAGLRCLLHDAPLRTRLAEAGRAYVLKQHSKERLIADIMRLYRDLNP